MMEYNITPIGKPRMTRSDAWKKRKCVMNYWKFKDKVNVYEVNVKNGDTITFILPMPKSWSKKKKLAMDGKPHQQKPDIDNLCKALLDSVYDDDSHIWDIKLQKLWGKEGKIIINT